MIRYFDVFLELGFSALIKDFCVDIRVNLAAPHSLHLLLLPTEVYLTEVEPLDLLISFLIFLAIYLDEPVLLLGFVKMELEVERGVLALDDVLYGLGGDPLMGLCEEGVRRGGVEGEFEEQAPRVLHFVLMFVGWFVEIDNN